MTNFLVVPNNFQLSDLLYHNLVEQRLAWNRVVKKGKSEKKENESFRYTDSWLVALTVAVKKKNSTLTLILMNQLTLSLINFLLLKENFKGINEVAWLTCDV